MKRPHTFALALALGVTPSLAPAQESPRVPLALTEVAHPVAVDPGGEVIVRGSVRSSHDGAIIDATTTRPGATGVEGEGAPVPGGLYDIEQGGWTLVSRDLRAHAYRLQSTGEPGPMCQAAGVSSPCLPLRMLPLAQTRLLAVQDFARSLSGQLTIEVLNPDSTPPPAPGFVAQHGLKALGAAALAAITYAVARTLKKRASTPEAAVRAAAKRARDRLKAGDPVHQRLGPSIDALVQHAAELASLRERLLLRVTSSDRAGLEARRADLKAREEKGVTEAAEARALVDEQLARIDRWRTESERASARIAQVREYLDALAQRLDEEISRAPADRDEATQAALKELELEVESALAGAREADRIMTT